MNLSALDKCRAFLGGFARDRTGAGALEFALVAPALIFLIMATIQISLALYKGSTVQWASERVLRMAMVDADISAATLQAQLQAAALAQLLQALLTALGYICFVAYHDVDADTRGRCGCGSDSGECRIRDGGCVVRNSEFVRAHKYARTAARAGLAR